MKSRDLYAADAPTGWMPWGVLAPVLCLAMVIVSTIVGSLILKPFIALDAKENPVSPSGLMTYTVVIFGLLLLVLLAWVRFVEGRTLAAIGLSGPHKISAFLGGSALACVVVHFGVGAIWLNGGFSMDGLGRAWTSPRALLSIALLFPCFALQSGVEELLFRGWLLSVLSKKFNVFIGVLVSSALFTLLHYEPNQPWLVTSTTLLFSLFCCAWALKSRSVLGVMGWHTGWNWLIAVGFGLPLTEINAGIPSLIVELKPTGAPWLTGGSDGPEGSAIFVVMLFVLTTCLLVALPLTSKRNSFGSKANG